MCYFDTIVERRGTNSLKYDFARERGKAENVLPMWVADMDFRTAPEILEKLEQSVRHGIFGYSEGKEEYFMAVERWYEKHFPGKLLTTYEGKDLSTSAMDIIKRHR